MMVTRAGLPPNAAMLSRTPLQGGALVQQAVVALYAHCAPQQADIRLR